MAAGTDGSGGPEAAAAASVVTDAAASPPPPPLDLASLQDIRDFARAKDLGNRFFQAGSWEAAAKCYTRALGCGDAEVQDKVAACGNLALCDLKRGRPREALAWCDRALEHGPKHVKSLYRKGQALELLGDLPCARKAFEKAAEAAKDPQQSASEALCGDVKRKLVEVTARIDRQNFEERMAKEAELRAREFELARLRPPPPPTEGPVMVSMSEGHTPTGYREKDWVPWLIAQIRESCEGDAEKKGRFRLDTPLGICMTYVPHQLPFGVDAKRLPGLQMTPSGMPGVAPLPPHGKEVIEWFCTKLVTGEVAEWRRGDHSGLRYDFQVNLFWRGLERTLSEENEKLEGTMQVTIRDEQEPKDWTVRVEQDVPHPRDHRNGTRAPEGKALKQMLEVAERLGERVLARVKELIAELTAKAAQPAPGVIGGSEACLTMRADAAAA